MKCLKSLACAMLVSMAVVCASVEEASEVTGKIALNRQNQAQITACIDALELAYPALGTTITALKDQNFAKAIRLLAVATPTDHMGLLSALLGSVQDVDADCKRGQGPDIGKALDYKKIDAELARRQRELDAANDSDADDSDYEEA